MLVPVIDGGIEKINAVFPGRDQGVRVGIVRGLIVTAEIRADAQARDLEAHYRPVKSGIPILREPVGIARSAVRGGEHRRAILYSETVLLSIKPRISAVN